MKTRTILVTGGAGYIGSHVCKALHERGFCPVVYDNLSHGNAWSVKWGPLVQGDLHDFSGLTAAIEHYGPIAAIHLAASIHARESILLPHSYYYNNVEGSRIFLQSLVENGIGLVVYTSSASVYGETTDLPLCESSLKAQANAYGKSKWIVEEMLEDFSVAHGLEYAALRCFNAAGADVEGKIGEAHPKETHLIPLAIETALGKKEAIAIHGNGGSMRDYVHVSDIAEAHVLALEHLLSRKGSFRVNIGSGKGHTIWDVLGCVEAIAGKKVAYNLQASQKTSHLIADIREAKSLLGWQPRHAELHDIVHSAWRWHCEQSGVPACC